MASRAVPEWIGRTPNSAIPPRVQVRVFERHNGVCWLSGRKILAGERWECDHVVALINGGEHRENNLAPALVKAHKAKTAEDVAVKSKTARMRAKHLGIKLRKGGRPMDGAKDSRWRKPFNGPAERRSP